MLKFYHFVFTAIILIIIVGMAAAGFGFGTKQQYKPVPYKNMWKNELTSEYVVFSSTRDGNYEIYSMNPDGSEVRRLTYNAAVDYSTLTSLEIHELSYTDQDFDGCISPDGQKIAFTSHRDGDYEIYIMNFDGSDQVRVTNSAGNDGSPAWSPDGTRIAFTSGRDDGFSEIYVMNADGTDQTNLTNSPGYYDDSPAWSPDGSQIAFVSSRDDTTAPNPFDQVGRVYLMNADGTNPRPLIDADSRWPSWSPDGTKIAFVFYPGFPVGASIEEQEKGSGELHVFDLISQTETILVTDPVVDGKVAWSPDGQEILFTSYARTGNIYIESEHGQLYRVSAMGSAPVQITFGASNGFADWKGTIAGPAIPTSEIEDTPTAEMISTPTIIETEILTTDTPEIVPTETPFPPTATPEVEDTATLEEIFTPTIVETIALTDTPVILPTETP
ncbi:MAG: hypothetical protein EHM33_04255 [Chloroflexi bacterium]|nr:MAG: hypothetical protein EHM33_04255 [Chloroflexota bacterium]